MSAVVVRYLVTLQEATKIIRFFKKKKHSGTGYFLNLMILGCQCWLRLKSTSLMRTATYRKHQIQQGGRNHAIY